MQGYRTRSCIYGVLCYERHEPVKCAATYSMYCCVSVHDAQENMRTHMCKAEHLRNVVSSYMHDDVLCVYDALPLCSLQLDLPQSNNVVCPLSRWLLFVIP